MRKEKENWFYEFFSNSIKKKLCLICDSEKFAHVLVLFELLHMMSTAQQLLNAKSHED